MNNKSNKKTSGKFLLLQKLAEFGDIDDKICGLCISTIEKVPIQTKTKIEKSGKGSFFVKMLLFKK